MAPKSLPADELVDDVEPAAKSERRQRRAKLNTYHGGPRRRAEQETDLFSVFSAATGGLFSSTAEETPKAEETPTRKEEPQDEDVTFGSRIRAALARSDENKKVDPVQADDLPGEVGGGSWPVLFWKPLEGVVGGPGEAQHPKSTTDELDVKPWSGEGGGLPTTSQRRSPRPPRQPKSPPVSQRDEEPPRRVPPQVQPRPKSAPAAPIEPPSVPPLPTPPEDPTDQAPSWYDSLFATRTEDPPDLPPKEEDPPDPPPSTEGQPHSPPRTEGPRDPPLDPPARVEEPGPSPKPNPQSVSRPRVAQKKSKPLIKPEKPAQKTKKLSDEPEPDPEFWVPSDADESDKGEVQSGPDMWSQSKKAVIKKRTQQIKVASKAPPPTRTEFTFAPAVALKMIPNYEAEIHRPPLELLVARTGRKKLVKSDDGSEKGYETKQVGVSAPTYQQVLDQVRRATPPGPAPVPLRMNYQNIVTNRLGHAALEPFATVPMTQFQNNMMSIGADYTNLARGLQVLPEDPHYEQKLQGFDVKFDGAGRPLEAADKEKLRRTFQENREIREKLMQDGVRMGSAVPPMKKNIAKVEGPSDERPLAPMLGGKGTEKFAAPPPAEETSAVPDKNYHKIELDILVIRATKLSEATGLYHCDPYVVVSAVDGNPLSEEALNGGEEWYSKHEQYHGETDKLESTTDPEWRCRLRAQIRPRPSTYIHFRVFDHDAAAATDRGIGQAAITLQDVQNNLFHGPRPIALEPFNKRSGRAWGDLRHARLFFSVAWQGTGAKLKYRMEGLKETHSTTISRARKRGLRPTDRQSAARGLPVEDAPSEEDSDE